MFGSDVFVSEPIGFVCRILENAFACIAEREVDVSWDRRTLRITIVNSLPHISKIGPRQLAIEGFVLAY